MVEKIARLLDKGSPLSIQEIRKNLEGLNRRTLLRLGRVIDSVASRKAKPKPKRKSARIRVLPKTKRSKRRRATGSAA